MFRLGLEDNRLKVLAWFMQTEQIVALLVAERDRFIRAIEALQGTAVRRGRPPGSDKKHAAAGHVSLAAAPKKKRKLSAAGRKAIADAARKRWAAIKAGKAASPFAKRAKVKKTTRA
jgi:hypothetical protein